MKKYLILYLGLILLLYGCSGMRQEQVFQVDGALVGGASLKPAFVQLVQRAASAA